MKAKCTKVSRKGDGWLTVGNSYVVIGILGRDCEILYRVNSDNGTPAFHDADLFELVSHQIFGEWLFLKHSEIEWELIPAVFAGSFWESYFDGDQGSRAIFLSSLKSLDV